ncbi:MAG TPA: TIGR03118 family protein [Gaiellaceae bacterium]|jgi:uncharacterized protein (TIGR03118 family)
MRMPWKWAGAGALALVVALITAWSATAASSFTVTPLVSDNGVPGTLTDPDLVNSWGLTASSTSPWWVADNGTGKATLYRIPTNMPTQKVPLIVAVGDAPTGTVFNSTTGLKLKNGTASLFLFDSEAGVISAWNNSVGTTAETEIPAADGAIFKGLAIAQTSAGPRLYATDFHNRRVDVFDGSWQPVNVPGQFVDKTLPDVYAPFGIQAIGNTIFVTYAKTQPKSGDEVHHAQFGYVDAYDAATGMLITRVASRGALNAPWGVAVAPQGFGDLGGDLLVGNFGDGAIHAYMPVLGGLSYVPLGPLTGADGSPLLIDGLWALQFGNGAAAGPTGTLFFTAGPNDENDGLFGSITPG